MRAYEKFERYGFQHKVYGANELVYYRGKEKVKEDVIVFRFYRNGNGLVSYEAYTKIYYEGTYSFDMKPMLIDTALNDLIQCQIEEFKTEWEDF